MIKELSDTNVSDEWRQIEIGLTGICTPYNRYKTNTKYVLLYSSFKWGIISGVREFVNVVDSWDFDFEMEDENLVNTMDRAVYYIKAINLEEDSPRDIGRVIYEMIINRYYGKNIW